MILSGEYDYSDPKIQEQALNLTKTLESTPYISSNPLYSENWLRNFLDYVLLNNEDYENVTLNIEKTFNEELKKTLLVPNSVTSLDVKFDKKGEHIIASRFLIQAVNISGTNQEKEMVKELRRICAESPLNASVFHPYFVFFDQFELVRPTSITCMIWGAIIMMIISFIFIPNVLCCLWVAFCIVSIELGVAGYMALWDVHLDSISMINLIMCIGFSVDFTAHICYAYMSSKKTRPDDRVKECLYSLGLPIVQGAISTILGLIALLLAGTYIFLVFFKMVFLVIFIGALHGLLLLPVLLSIFGPGSCTNHEKAEEEAKRKELEERPYVIPHPTLYFNQPGGVKSIKDSPATSLVVLEERDPGLGTSEDSNSTESGSSQSRRRQQQEEAKEENQRRYDGWRRSVGMLQSISQFQAGAAPPPDYPGAGPLDAAPRSLEPRILRSVPYHNYHHSYREHPIIHTQPQLIEYRRSRSQHNLHHPAAARYFTDPSYH